MLERRSADYLDGQQIPGTVYRVCHMIGQGGMGTVYDVEDTTVGKRYVLKTLHSNLVERSDLATRLAREARALAKLQHPNIVEVYTSGTTKDSLRLPYYVMEKLNGKSLREVLEKVGHLGLDRAIDIGIDLLDALDHAHEFGIIHRDVKPDNIFICKGRDGRSVAKLLDFGIIKLATGPASSATMATGGRFIGTFRYAPPEQILGHDVTPQSDLYSAALVIYEMIAGRGPYDDFTGEMEIGKAHIDVPPPPLSRFAAVPQPIEQLVMSALDKTPALRPRDAFVFASALRDFKRQLAGGGPVTSALTVRQLDAQPASAARPAVPFGAESVAQPPSAQIDTRVDSRAAQLADTAAAPGVMSARSQTLSLGVIAQPGTYAAAPIEQSVQGAQSPGAIDRHAETREAVPQIAQRPNYDTAPIPLAVFARPESTPPPRNETFGAHTTEASQRKKSARSAIVAVAIAVVAFVGVVGVAGVFVWKQRHAAQNAASASTVSATVTTTSAAAPNDAPAASTATATDTTTATSAPANDTAPAATGSPVTTTATPVARTQPATTHTTTLAPPARTASVATPATQVAKSAPSTAPTRHLPGSGL